MSCPGGLTPEQEALFERLLAEAKAVIMKAEESRIRGTPQEQPGPDSSSSGALYHDFDATTSRSWPTLLN